MSGSSCCTESCFEWAAAFTSDTPVAQGGPSAHGTMFIDFHINGDPKSAAGYFKSLRETVFVCV